MGFELPPTAVGTFESKSARSLELGASNSPPSANQTFQTLEAKLSARGVQGRHG
jgi:hypothetical protein